MLRVCITGFLMVALATSAPLNAQAGSVSAAGGGDFGDDTSGVAQALLWHSPTFSLPAIASLDSIDIELAHLYGSDVELRLVDTNGNTTVIIEGDLAPNSTNGQDDFTQLGDGGGIAAANVRTYTLVDSPTPIFPDASGGALAAGTYGTDGWSAGSFPAGTWTLEIWDTWSGNDGGYVGDVTLNFTAVPEPATIGLAVLAMGGILGLRRRNR